MREVISFVALGVVVDLTATPSFFFLRNKNPP